MNFYDEHHAKLQEQFESRDLAQAMEFAIVQPELNDEAISFIEKREFFFLSTVRSDGQPTVSHKGGAPGFVRAIDPTTIVFPSYDGNGMFFSMGNIAATAKVGMLFIDFETPHRVRVHANATVSVNDPLLAEFPGAQLLVRATVTESFINCPRY
ncbi:MAG: pyridoxamine 5'-phosphate oxidase family protein, partial [Acidimicrobiales bacterium]